MGLIKQIFEGECYLDNIISWKDLREYGRGIRWSIHLGLFWIKYQDKKLRIHCNFKVYKIGEYDPDWHRDWLIPQGIFRLFLKKKLDSHFYHDTYYPESDGSGNIITSKKWRIDVKS